MSLSEWNGKPFSTNNETISTNPRIMVWKVWNFHQNSKRCKILRMTLQTYWKPSDFVQQKFLSSSN